jgi:hypothetical protein
MNPTPAEITLYALAILALVLGICRIVHDRRRRIGNQPKTRGQLAAEQKLRESDRTWNS